jgi:transcriptional regulator with XRE-family HTH domain
VAATLSPTVRRRRLASELRRLREAAKLTCEDVAELLECSASKISRIETARVTVAPRDVRDLLRIYGVPDDQHDSLLQLARDSRQKGWWQAYGASVEPHFATYLGMESAASEIKYVNLTRIPVLLQTEDYAREVIAVGRMRRSVPEHDMMVDLLLESQRLAQASPPDVWVVMDEAALRRQVGGLDVMREQIDHLIQLTSTPGVFLQFIPFSAGAHAAMDLPFVIMSFPDPADPDVVCMGYQTGVLWIEDMSEVHRYNNLFRHLQASALSLDESVALMTAVLKEM